MRFKPESQYSSRLSVAHGETSYAQSKTSTGYTFGINCEYYFLNQSISRHPYHIDFIKVARGFSMRGLLPLSQLCTLSAVKAAFLPSVFSKTRIGLTVHESISEDANPISMYSLEELTRYLTSTRTQIQLFIKSIK